jgi:hypothetical protein
MMTGYPYLAEYSAVVPISFHIKNSTKRADLVIICHHGWGGSNSRQMGGDINKFLLHAKSGFDNFDIALYGHVHKLFCIPDIILDCKSRKNWIEQKIVLVGTVGTFLRTMEEGKGSTYAERGGMPPRVLSWLEVDIELYRTGDHKKRGGDSLGFRYPHIVPSS